jgi:RNA polymerase sigma factor (sigma-70 family)
MAARQDTLLQYIQRLAVRPALAEFSDAALLAHFIETRDDPAFAALVNRHGSLVMQVCRRILGDGTDAEDAFQAVFMVLARKARSVRRREALPAWLHGVARRVALSARSERQRKLRLARSTAASGVDPHPDPLEDVSGRELLFIVDEEVKRLPKAYRLPVILCCLEGRTLEEAARQLGWKPGSVKGRLERGRERLHARLVRRGLTLSAVLAAAEVSRGTTPATVLAGLALPTARAAIAFGRGQDLMGQAGRAAVLAHEVLKGIALAKSRLIAFFVACALATGCGLVVANLRGKPLLEAVQESPTEEATIVEVQHAQPLDAYGDPLPAGAIKRLGTERFRLGGGTATGLYLANGGKSLISNALMGARAVQVWESTTGKLIRSFPGNYANVPIAVSKDGRMVAIPEGAKIGLRDVASGQLVRRYEANDVTDVKGVAFSPNGETLASGDQRGTIHFWHTATGQRFLQYATGKTDAVSLLAFSPDGKILASGSNRGGSSIQLWDAATQRSLYTLPIRRGTLTTAVFSPDGLLLAAGVNSGPALIWDVRTGKLVRRLQGLPWMDAIAFSPDGKVLATNECDVSTAPVSDHISLWDVATGQLLQRMDHEAINALAFSLDGKTIFAGTGGPAVITSHDVASGKQIGPAKEAALMVDGLALSPDSRTLAYLALDKGARLHLNDLSTGADLVWPERNVGCPLFSPDGRRIAYDCSKEVCIRDVRSQEVIQRLKYGSNDPNESWNLVCTAFSPSGKTLAMMKA